MPARDDIPGSVLFACTENALRSPMAEAMMKHFHGHHVYVDSVGVRAGTLDGFAIEVMAEMGLDIKGHQPKAFEDLEDTSFDLIVSLSPEAQHSAVELTRSTAAELEFWPTFDPGYIDGGREERLQAYREVRDALLARIRERFRVEPAGHT
jgi:protein-tyrosine-phosphatase